MIIRTIDSYAGFRIYNPLGIQLIDRLRVDFTRLNEHNFKYDFPDVLNPLCSCSLKTERSPHFFLRCQPILIFVEPSGMK